MIRLREIFNRVSRHSLGEECDWPNPRSDAVFLAQIAARLIEQIHRLNERLPPESRVSLCPLCGSYTWSRPGLSSEALQYINGTDTNDYTRRRCSECGHIRTNPKEEAHA